MKILQSFPLRAAALMAAGSLTLSPIVALANNDSTTTKENHIKTEIKAEVKSASVEIGPSGNVHVQGATVTGVSAGSVSATTAWGSTTLSWTVRVGSSTEMNSKNGKVVLAEVQTGDKVNFQGKLDSSATGLTIDAKVFRDVSIVKETKILLRDIFQGALQSLSATSTPTTLTLKSGDKTLSVNISATTQILNKNFAPTTLASFQNGDTIRVYGSVNSATSTTVNALIVRDASR